jgi:hypothetical protein
MTPKRGSNLENDLTGWIVDIRVAIRLVELRKESDVKQRSARTPITVEWFVTNTNCQRNIVPFNKLVENMSMQSIDSKIICEMGWRAQHTHMSSSVHLRHGVMKPLPSALSKVRNSSLK